MGHINLQVIGIKVVMKTGRKRRKPREKVVDTSLGGYRYLKED